jgi:hypothetical protein
LYPRAFSQFTTCLMRELGLRILITPLYVGWDKFIFINFHFCSLLIMDALVFRKSKTHFWNEVVGLLLKVQHFFHE